MLLGKATTPCRYQTYQTMLEVLWSFNEFTLCEIETLHMVSRESNTPPVRPTINRRRSYVIAEINDSPSLARHIRIL